MTDLSRPEPFFIADHAALDFLNSIVKPTDVEIEWIAKGVDLVAWLETSGLLPAEVATRFALEPSALLDCVATRARELREWFRTWLRAHAGETLQPAALGELQTLNRLLVQDDTHWQIEASRHDPANARALSPMRWRQSRRWRSPEDLLLPLAKSMGDLLCEADFSHIRKCEGATCTLWFLDITKNHTRRWCSMAICGNRAKAAAHRARKRDAVQRVRGHKSSTKKH